MAQKWLLVFVVGVLGLAFSGACKEEYVAPAPNPSWATADSAETFADTPITVQVLDNDENPRGNTERVFRVTQPPNGTVIISSTGEVKYTPNSGFVHGAGESDTFTYTVRDAEGFRDETTVEVTVKPIPELIAPTPDESVPTNFSENTSFLTSGANPVQVNVEPEALNEEQVAVLRGLVVDTLGAPISGVSVSVVGFPEYGLTVTRNNTASAPNDAGRYDIAVNGGVTYTLEFSKENFLSKQISVDAPLQDFLVLDDVTLVGISTQVAQVPLGTQSQTVSAPQVIDPAGTRQPQVLLPAGTGATIQLPDGSSVPASNLSLQVTEYTVGTNVESVLPAPLPQGTGVAYAVEFTVQQAANAGATTVEFSQPITQYVENFLGLPVGSSLPTGSLNTATGSWEPEPDGTVVQITGFSGGQALIDINGDGTPDSGASLSNMFPPITTEELQNLNTTYNGQATPIELWRVPISHFSAVAVGFPRVAANGGNDVDVRRPRRNDNLLDASEDPIVFDRDIAVEPRAVREELPIPGSPFNLVYRSDRSDGYSNTLVVPIAPPGGFTNAPNSIVVDVDVAGQKISQTVNAPFSADQTVKLTWNGQNGYNQTINGLQEARVTITYSFNAIYKVPLASSIASGTSSFGNVGLAFIATASNQPTTRVDFKVTRRFNAQIGTFRFGPKKLGGWSVDAHHTFDSTRGILFRGDGRVRRGLGGRKNLLASDKHIVSELVAPQLNGVSIGESFVTYPTGVAVRKLLDQFGQPTGQVETYFVDTVASTIRMIDSAGVVHRIAGTGSAGINGTSGFATTMKLFCALGMAVHSNGTIYVADTLNSRIVRIDPAPATFTISELQTSTDGKMVVKLATAGDVLNFAANDVLRFDSIQSDSLRRELANTTVRVVSTNLAQGTITTNAPAARGIFSAGSVGKDRTFTALPSAGINKPAAVALTGDGNTLFVASTGSHTLLQITNPATSPSTPTLIAGTGAGNRTFNGDGAALSVNLGAPGGITCTSDGSIVYFADTYLHRIRRLQGGQITTIAGGNAGFADGTGAFGPATVGGATNSAGSRFQFPVGIVLRENGAGTADDELFVCDTENALVRRIQVGSLAVSTLVGVLNDRSISGSESQNFADAPARSARLYPVSVSLGSGDTIVIADYENNALRQFTLAANAAASTASNVTVRAAATSPTGLAGLSGTRPYALAVTVDGVVWVDRTDNRVRSHTGSSSNVPFFGSGIATDFIPTTSGHPVALVNTPLRQPSAIAYDITTGAYYVAETGTDRHRILKISTSSSGTTFEVFAGTGTPGFSGDGGPAVQAQLNNPSGLVVANDGLFVADTDNNVIRFIDFEDGIIRTVIGSNGVTNDNGVGNFGTNTNLSTPIGLALDEQGSLYYSDLGHKVVRKLDSKTKTIADVGFTGLGGPRGISVAPDGTVYVADTGKHRIVRMIQINGAHVQETILGTGSAGFVLDALDAGSTQLSSPTSVRVVDNGTALVVADNGNSRLLRVEIAAVPKTTTEVYVPNDDGTEAYVFDTSGRHLRTVDGFRGNTRYTFGYDASNRLITIADANANTIVTINRNASGDPTSIATQGGRTMTIQLTNSMITRYTVPTAPAMNFDFTYTNQLMQSRTLPDGTTTHSYAYDGDGQLTTATRSSGRTITLTRTIASNTPAVQIVDTLNATSRTHTVEINTGGVGRRVVEDTVGADQFTRSRTGFTRQLPGGSSYSPLVRNYSHWGGMAPMVGANILGATVNPSAKSLRSNPFNLTGRLESAQIDGFAPHNLSVAEYRRFLNGSTSFVTDTFGGSSEFTFDAAMRVATQTEKSAGSTGRTVTYGYDSFGFANTVAISGFGQSATFTVSFGASTTAQLSMGDLRQTWTYDSADRLSAHTVVQISNSRQLYAASYTYDSVGRLQTWQQTYDHPSINGGTPMSLTTTYTYTANGWLATASVTGGITRSYTYSYDDAGNVAALEGNALAYTKDRAISLGGAGITYDANLRDTTNSRTYNLRGNLSAYGPATYLYTPSDQRVFDQAFVPGGTNPLTLHWRDQTPRLATLHNDSPAVFRQFVYVTDRHVPDIVVNHQASTAYMLITDHRGTPYLMLNITDGSLVGGFLHWGPFGEMDTADIAMMPTSAADLAIGYAGGLVTAPTTNQTDLLTAANFADTFTVVQLGYRLYDRAKGRWIQPNREPFAHMPRNPYAYVGNDPVNFTTTTGGDVIRAGRMPWGLGVDRNPLFKRQRPLHAR